MATRSKKTPAKKTAPPPNLFQRAGKDAKDTPKKKKGTVFVLPRDLDGDGKLVGDSLALNDAVEDVIAAETEKKTATNKGNLAKGLLARFAVGEYVKTFAKLSVLPPGPISVLNHKGQSCTYVVQDKSQQNALDEEQVALLQDLLGVEAADRIITKREIYSFTPETMKEVAAGEKAKKDETVQDVVFDIVSNALMGSPKLSDEQKATLIASTSKTYLAANTLPRAAELCGADASRIKSLLEVAGSAIVRYIKP